MKTFKQFLNKDVKSTSELADKHKVAFDKIVRAVTAGTKIEKEHTTKKEVAKQIALAHVGEDPNYYKKLRKIEK